MQRTPLGAVDALATGFTPVNRCLWVVAVIIVLDLVLWFGPVANAYIATGVVTAIMLYYREGYALWRSPATWRRIR